MKPNIKIIFIWISIGLLIAAGVITSGCSNENASKVPVITDTLHAPETTPVPGISKPPSLTVGAIPEISSYLPGETVQVRIAFKNSGENPVQIKSFPPEISVNNPSFGVVRSYPCGSDTITIESGGSYDYIMKWDQCNNDEKQTEPGIYSVEILDVSCVENGNEILYYSEGRDVAQVVIEYPGGAIEDKLFVNQSKNMGRYIVTLKSLILSPTVSQAQILISSTDKPFFEPTVQSDVPTPMPTPPNLDPSGYYQIDNGTKKEFVSEGYKIINGDVMLLWDFEPLPSDAGELYLVITKLGNQRDNCEFPVNLTKELS